MSAIKFGESLSKFMIPIALLEKFGSLCHMQTTKVQISLFFIWRLSPQDDLEMLCWWQICKHLPYLFCSSWRLSLQDELETLCDDMLICEHLPCLFCSSWRLSPQGDLEMLCWWHADLAAITFIYVWAGDDKTDKVICAPSEDTDQPGHLPRVFAVSLKGS